VLDELSRRWELPPPKARFKGRLTEGRIPGSQAALPKPPSVALLWPLTYMNDAGRSVGPARGSFKLALDQVLVLHDEIDLPFGEIRARLGGGLAGHNGLKSIKQALGSAEFWRIRIGVGRPPSSDPEVVSSYVLGRFKERASEVSELVACACEQAEALVLSMRDLNEEL
jgi:peptidyl-tRNA hydrolase, PTH1 family